MMKKIILGLLGLAAMLQVTTALAGSDNDHLHLYDHPTPYLSDNDLPQRTGPLIEIGTPMLGPGKIPEGFTLPTCANWQPRLWIYGVFRTALQYFRQGASPNRTLEWGNRLDLFANLQLSGTERIVLGVEPLHRDNEFTRYTFEPSNERGFTNALNADITTLFFEGDLGEIFPTEQRFIRGGGDIGFAIGRQPIFFQEGILINDTVDAIGVTQNSMSWQGISNFQLTGYVGVNNIDRNDNRSDDDATLYGIHARADSRKHTVDFDLVYVDSETEPHDPNHLIVGGIGSVQRWGHWGTSVRFLVSHGTRQLTPQSNDGAVLFFESNVAPGDTHDIFYVNAAVAQGTFTSAARGRLVGGPLGRTGILFASAGVGGFGAAMSNQASDVVATAIGYQKYFTCDVQGTLEVGGRLGTSAHVDSAYGIGALLQAGIGRRTVLSFFGFWVDRERQIDAFGARVEMLVKF